MSPERSATEDFPWSVIITHRVRCDWGEGVYRPPTTRSIDSGCSDPHKIQITIFGVIRGQVRSLKVHSYHQHPDKFNWGRWLDEVQISDQNVQLSLC